MADGKKSDWPFLIGGLVCIGLIGGIYSLFTKESFVGGFLGSLRAFGIAAAIVAAYAGSGALVGYVLGKNRDHGKEWATTGAGVGFFIFLVYGQVGL